MRCWKISSKIPHSSCRKPEKSTSKTAKGLPVLPGQTLKSFARAVGANFDEIQKANVAIIEERSTLSIYDPSDRILPPGTFLKIPNAEGGSEAVGDATRPPRGFFLRHHYFFQRRVARWIFVTFYRTLPMTQEL